MVWFEYKYITSSDIINTIKLISEYSIIEYSILVFLILFLIFNIYYLLPIYNIYSIEKAKIKEKEKKKKLLKLIQIQDKINKEIEKELDIH